jgi:hypothetical protein
VQQSWLNPGNVAINLKNSRLLEKEFRDLSTKLISNEVRGEGREEKKSGRER